MNNQFTHDVAMSEDIKQMHKKQDETYSGFCKNEATGEEFYYGGVWDGHGTDRVINCLRSVKHRLNDFMKLQDTLENLSRHIVNDIGLGGGYNSGATMCFAKCYSDRIECINWGDSRMVVYKNGEIVYISEEHDTKNEKERERLQSKKVTYTKSTGIKIMSSTKMVSTECEYVNFTNGTEIAPTLILGHNRITETPTYVSKSASTSTAASTVTIQFEPSDVIKIVIGSDGLFDMIFKDENEKLVEEDVKTLCGMSGADILTQTVNRWLQPWDIYMCDNPDELVGTQTFEQDGCDDVSVVVINMKPLII